MSGTGKRFIFAFHCLLNYETRNRNIKSLNSNEIKIVLFLTCPSISLKASKIRISVSQTIHLLDFNSHFNGPFSSLLDSGFSFHWMHVYSDFGSPLLSSLAASILIVVSIAVVGGGHEALLIRAIRERDGTATLSHHKFRVRVVGARGLQSMASRRGAPQPVPETFPGSISSLSASCRHGCLLAHLTRPPPAASVPFYD